MATLAERVRGETIYLGANAMIYALGRMPVLRAQIIPVLMLIGAGEATAFALVAAPNPATSKTRISDRSARGRVIVSIFDALGRHIGGETVQSDEAFTFRARGGRLRRPRGGRSRARRHAARRAALGRKVVGDFSVASLPSSASFGSPRSDRCPTAPRRPTSTSASPSATRRSRA